jgi:hypothetical protein
MKSKPVLLMFLLVVLSAGLCFGSSEQGKKPIAFAPEPVFEFQPVLDGDEVIHDFIIKNTGTDELKIDRVQTG